MSVEHNTPFMDKLNSLIKEMEDLFREERYDLFVLDCGRKIESLLKESFKDYIDNNAPAPVKDLSKRYLSSHRKSSFDYLTFGELIDLFEKTDFLKTIYKSAAKKSLSYLGTVKDIRNKVAHPNTGELGSEAKAEAFIVYGMILLLAKPAAIVQHTTKEVLREPKRIIMTPLPSSDSEAIKPAEAANAGEKIWFCKNKSSGKCFVYIEDETDQTMLLVTSESQVKSLNKELFEPPVENTKQYLISAGLITEAQVEAYYLYQKQEEEDSHTGQIRRTMPFRMPNPETQGITQDDLIPYIIQILEKHGGRLRKSEVEKEIYRLFEKTFKQPWYQETVSNDVPRWRHYIAWAKERAKKKGLIKHPNDSGRGYWELA